jgi:hypothetical protein
MDFGDLQDGLLDEVLVDLGPLWLPRAVPAGELVPAFPRRYPYPLGAADRLADRALGIGEQRSRSRTVGEVNRVLCRLGRGRPGGPRGRLCPPDGGGAALRRAVGGADMTGDDARPVAGREDALQEAVFGLLLLAHPAQRSVEEIVREMTERPDEFPARDAINNAIRDLAGAGLAHRHGAFVFATRAAVRFDELCF